MRSKTKRFTLLFTLLFTLCVVGTGTCLAGDCGSSMNMFTITSLLTGKKVKIISKNSDFDLSKVSPKELNKLMAEEMRIVGADSYLFLTNNGELLNMKDVADRSRDGDKNMSQVLRNMLRDIVQSNNIKASDLFGSGGRLPSPL